MDMARRHRSSAAPLALAWMALVAYAQAGHVNWAMGLPMAAGGLLSISWGVALAHSLPERMLRLAFCGLLSGTALAMF